MTVEPRQGGSKSAVEPAVHRIGCVSYLNAKPLIDGLEEGSGLPIGGTAPLTRLGRRPPQVQFDVPSRLLEALEAGRVDLALCPVIDYYRAATPLVIVPVGAIGCDGSTLTVRLFSRTPIDRITAVHADSDSNTSVALLRVLLDELYDLHPRIVVYHAGDRGTAGRPTDPPQTILLIGDKVVTDAPSVAEFTHQLDLGTAWKRLTGLPFVFAVWMARHGAPLGQLPQILERQRDHNAGRIDAIVDRHAETHGWSVHLARDYLGRILHYRVGARQLEAIERFGAMAARLGLVDRLRPLELWGRQA